LILPNDPPNLLPTLEFDLNTKALTLGIYQVSIAPGMLRSQGSVYVPDLLGSELRVSLEEAALAPVPWANDYKVIIHRSKLKRFELTIGSQVFVLPVGAFKRVTTDHNSVYSMMMPANQAGLDALLQRQMNP
jgi:hypothetical protein